MGTPSRYTCPHGVAFTNRRPGRGGRGRARDGAVWTRGRTGGGAGLGSVFSEGAKWLEGLRVSGGTRGRDDGAGASSATSESIEGPESGGDSGAPLHATVGRLSQAVAATHAAPTAAVATSASAAIRTRRRHFPGSWTSSSNSAGSSITGAVGDGRRTADAPGEGRGERGEGVVLT